MACLVCAFFSPAVCIDAQEFCSDSLVPVASVGLLVPQGPGEQSDMQAAKQIFVQQSAILDMLGLGDSHGFRNLSPGHGTLHLI